ncbi:hypothetical protein F383_39455 [Gossypium arboreum]|uniref:Uncharacterized protein n=1 Tax=Gossypium arboreum TaxID=29729 RepID=A0A0B0MSR7_GOSAR|nr:hypothetical protein F383_39455 [Gossypium arboreum]
MKDINDINANVHFKIGN